MFLGNAADFGGSTTEGGQWIDVRPSFNASLSVWRQALAMTYAGAGIGPGALGMALAERYLSESNLPDWVIKSVSEFAYSIAQISDKITVETILKGVEFAIHNIPDGLDIPGNYGSWRALTFASIDKPTQYPIDVSVFGDDANAAQNFVTHKTEQITFTPVKTTTGTVKTGQANFMPSPVIKTDPSGPVRYSPQNLPQNLTQYSDEPLNQQSSGSGIRIAAIAAALASFLF
jgi:hypothetical protein